jgi:hypothetical protein
VTQILSCLTRDYVLQVSDRRLTYLCRDGTLKLDEDDQTKAIVVNRALIFAYAGWGEIEKQSTNEWFASVIKRFADADQLRDGTLEVARRATAYFARPRYPPIPPEQKRHTFIGVGWRQQRRDGRVIPAAVRITNAFDNQGQLLPRARPDFVVQNPVLPRLSGGIKMLETGGYVDQARLLTLERYLRRQYYLRTPLHPARLLAKELRSLSDKLRAKYPVSPVGKNLLVTCLPKVAALSWSIPVLGPPDGKSFSTFYVLAEGTTQISKSATIVQKGLLTLLSDIGLEVPPPSDGSDPYAGWR